MKLGCHSEWLNDIIITMLFILFPGNWVSIVSEEIKFCFSCYLVHRTKFQRLDFSLACVKILRIKIGFFLRLRKNTQNELNHLF